MHINLTSLLSSGLVNLSLLHVYTGMSEITENAESRAGGQGVSVWVFPAFPLVPLVCCVLFIVCAVSTVPVGEFRLGSSQLGFL